MKKKIISLMLTLIILCTAFINVSACHPCYVNMYYDILAAYGTCYRGSASVGGEVLFPHPEVRSYIKEKKPTIYYAFHDFADDGVPELLISCLNYHGEHRIYGIYGIENGEVKVIDNECGVRWGYDVCKGNILKYSGSSGAANNIVKFMKFDKNSAVPRTFSYVEMDGFAKNVFTKGTTLGAPVYPITEEEYYSAGSGYEMEELVWHDTMGYAIIDYPIEVMLQGKALTFDTCPEIIGGRTMVPMRAIFEAMGAVVTWDDSTKSVFASKSGIDIKLSVGQCEMYKNGAMIWLDSAPIIKAGRTLVPVRAVSEAFGLMVEWDGENKVVSIY